MGALGPADLQLVFECLNGALSQNSAIQKQAEAALHSLEARPGFCSCLAEIIDSKDANHSARWLAAVHFKNSVNKYWRSRVPGSLTADEKAHIRHKLLELIEQEDSQIAVQVAIVFAKVARFDYPHACPSLLGDLLGRLQGGSTLAVRRVYLVLHHILKELASKRLLADQRNFEQITAGLLEPVWTQWVADTQAITSALSAALQALHAAQQPLLLVFERWLLQLKALRRMAMFGFQSDARTLQEVPAVGRLTPALLQTLQAFVALRPPLAPAPASGAAGQAPAPAAGRSQLGAMVDRGILKLLKSLRQIQETHPWSFYHCGALLPCLEFCHAQIVASGGRGGGHTAEQYSIQCLLFIYGAQTCQSYKGASATLTLNLSAREQAGSLKALAGEVQAALSGFWGAAGRLQALCTTLIERYFPLTEKELEEWEDDPEAFYHEVENLAWEESSRGCAENTYLALFEGYRESMAPVVMGLLKRASEGCPPGAAAHLQGPTIHGIPAAVLAKEAAYHAVAVGAFELFDFLDLSAWLHGALLQEMSDAAPAAKPLRRRAINVISYWTDKLKKEDRPALYRSLLGVLSCQDNAALQLTAVATLHALVDGWEFYEDQFLEFGGSFFQLLAGLLQHSTVFDTQLQTFNLINLVIDRLGPSIRPYAPGLLQLMPALWERAEGQSLLRIQVLLALQRLVNALGPQSAACYPLLLPVLRLCTDPSQPDELNLLEDGLQLWLVALRNAPGPQPAAELLALFPHLEAVMGRSTEHIAVGMKIAASCVLLGGGEFLQRYGAGLVQVLVGFIGNVKERGTLALLPVMDVVIQCFPGEGPRLLSPALQRLLATCLLPGSGESGLVVAAALGVLARVLLHNAAFFLQFFEAAAAAQQPGLQAQQLLLSVLDLWLDKFDSIGQPAARKLSALALCVLLPVPLPGLLDRLELIATHITSVWFEVEGVAAGSGGGQVHYGYDFYNAMGAGAEPDEDAVVDSEEAEGESERRKQLHELDPVNTLRLSSFCKQQLEAASAVHGPALAAALNAMDPVIARQLKGMLEA